MPEAPLAPAAPETWPCPCCRGLGDMADGMVEFRPAPDGILTGCEEGGMATPAEILTSAAAVYLRGRGQYRDALLETGRLLHDYVLAHMRQGDGLKSWECERLKYTRQAATATAAAALGVNAGKVSTLIAVASAVDLLAEAGAAGGLAWGTLSLFARLVRRRTAGQKGKGRPGRGGVPNSSGETWEVIPGLAEAARELFRRAVAEGLAYEQVRPAVLRLYLRVRRGSPKRRRVSPAEQTAVDTLRLSAAVASPGDLVEMLAALAEKAPDPVAVAEQLLQRLRATRDAKRHTLYSEAGA